MNKTRLEAFSDGVFAIIITIMVLEVKVPQGTSWEVIKPLLPVFGSYVLSFVFIGIYWGNHHHILHTAKRVNGAIMWANMHLLFWLSLIPFATGWMGVNNFDKIPVAVYCVLLVFCGLAFNIVSSLICKTYTEQTKLSCAIAKTNAKGLWSFILYTLAIPAAIFIHPGIAALLIVSVSVMWIIPSKQIEEALNDEG
jgi:uncharacterized membrane protein